VLSCKIFILKTPLVLVWYKFVILHLTKIFPPLKIWHPGKSYIISNSPKCVPGWWLSYWRPHLTTVTRRGDADEMLWASIKIWCDRCASISRQGLTRYVNKLSLSPRDVYCTYDARPRRLYIQYNISTGSYNHRSLIF